MNTGGASEFVFTAAKPSPYLIEARAQLPNRTPPFGPSIRVEGGGTPATARIRILGLALPSADKVEVGFVWESGKAASFLLQHAESLGGTWSTEPSLPVPAAEPGVFLLQSTRPRAASRLFRILAQ